MSLPTRFEGVNVTVMMMSDGTVQDFMDIGIPTKLERTNRTQLINKENTK